MYVTYYVYSSGEGECTFGTNPKNFINNPSECLWMVPGTVGIDD